MTRIRITEDQRKRRLVEAWDHSGLAAKEFADGHGLHWATLRAWGRTIRGPLPRSRRARPVPRALELVEVTTGPAVVHGVEPRMEIVLSGGRRLVLFADWTPDLVAEIAIRLEGGR